MLDIENRLQIIEKSLKSDKPKEESEVKEDIKQLNQKIEKVEGKNQDYKKAIEEVSSRMSQNKKALEFLSSEISENQRDSQKAFEDLKKEFDDKLHSYGEQLRALHINLEHINENVLGRMSLEENTVGSSVQETGNKFDFISHKLEATHLEHANLLNLICARKANKDLKTRTNVIKEEKPHWIDPQFVEVKIGGFEKKIEDLSLLLDNLIQGERKSNDYVHNIEERMRKIEKTTWREHLLTLKAEIDELKKSVDATDAKTLDTIDAINTKIIPVIQKTNRISTALTNRLDSFWRYRSNNRFLKGEYQRGMNINVEALEQILYQNKGSNNTDYRFIQVDENEDLKSVNDMIREFENLRIQRNPTDKLKQEQSECFRNVYFKFNGRGRDVTLYIEKDKAKTVNKSESNHQEVHFRNGDTGSTPPTIDKIGREALGCNTQEK